MRLTNFLIHCKHILWINQIIKDNTIKGEYKVDKNKPCNLISLDKYYGTLEMTKSDY